MGNRIKELRKKNKLSQIALSIKLEVSQETVSAYENGKYFPSFETLVKLSKIFNTSIDYLMGLSGDNEPTETANLTENILLSSFRKLPPHEKELAMAYTKGLSDSEKTG